MQMRKHQCPLRKRLFLFNSHIKYQNKTISTRNKLRFQFNTLKSEALLTAEPPTKSI